MKTGLAWSAAALASDPASVSTIPLPALLDLQRTAGNAAVSELLLRYDVQREVAEAGPPSPEARRRLAAALAKPTGVHDEHLSPRPTAKPASATAEAARVKAAGASTKLTGIRQAVDQLTPPPPTPETRLPEVLAPAVPEFAPEVAGQEADSLGVAEPEDTALGAAASEALQLPSAETPQTQTVLDLISAAHDQGVSELKASLEGAATALGLAVSAQHAAIDARSAAGVQSITETFSRARGEARLKVDRHRGELQAAAEVEGSRLAAWEGQAADRAAGELGTRAARVREAAAGNSERSAQIGSQASERMRTRLNELASQARAIGRAREAAPGDPDTREVRAKAARELMDETLKQLADAGRDAEPALRGQGAEVGRTLTQQAEQLAKQIEGQAPILAGQVAGMKQSAARSLHDALASSDQAVTQAGVAGDQHLSTQQTQVVRSLHTQAATRKRQIGIAGKQAIGVIQERGTAAAKAGTTAVSQLGAAFTEGGPGPTGAEQAGVAMAQAVRDSFGTVRDGTRQAGAQAAGGVDAAGAAVGEAMEAAADQAAAGANAPVQEAGEHLGQLAQLHQRQMRQVTSHAAASGDGMVSQVLTGLDQQVAGTTGQFGQVLASFDAGMADQVTMAIGKAGEPVTTLDSRIGQAQQKAEADAKKGWWARQWDDLVSLVSSPSFWVGLAAGLLVGALIIVTAGAATPFVIMGAAVAGGMAAGAASTVTQNLVEGKRGWHVLDNVLRNTLIGGLAGGVGAAIVLFGVGATGAGGLVAGLGLTGTGAALFGFAVLEVSAVVSNAIANVLSGQPWDKGLVAALLLAPLVAKLAERLGLSPEETGAKQGEGQQPGEQRPLTREERYARMTAAAKARAEGQELTEGIARADAKLASGERALPQEDIDWLNADPRHKQLAYDPAIKFYRVGEAKAVLVCEDQGILAGPVRRSFEGGYDYVDGGGRQWSFKGGPDPAAVVRDVVAEATAGKDVVGDVTELSPEQQLQVGSDVQRQLGSSPHGEVRYVPRLPSGLPGLARTAGATVPAAGIGAQDRDREPAGIR